MELREFATRVLFATTLEEKLASIHIESITDDQPGPPIQRPVAPGRPRQLSFKEGGAASADLPRGSLERAEQRGRLLHAFANHELLATELMALVLLRFPNAPSAFRRGVLQTLLDEQEHTRLYLERLRSCGIEFGELPVSGYFWRAIAGMESPLDYVAGLSLTFEQANLDFARHFADGFAAAGDAESARLLARIHRDEIAHVAHGLKWFRRWKDPGHSDWDAFCRHLRYPLSPQRAKGFAVHIDSRRAAGLDPTFIAELDVYAQSKGRTPGVFVFNPFAEGHLALGRAFTPVRSQVQLADDLANLPQFLCRQDDVVLVPKRPSVEFLSDLKQIGFRLPEFVETGGAPAEAIHRLATRKLGALRPWAWGPDSFELFGPLFECLSDSARHELPTNGAELTRLYSKAWSAALLGQVLAAMPTAEWLCPPDVVGFTTNTLDEAAAAIERIRQRGYHRIVLKESLGLAGRNALRLWEPAILETQWQWIRNAFGRGIQLVVEPWLERESDFSIQLEMGRAGLKVRGYTRLINDRRGQFLGNSAAPNFLRQLPAELLAQLKAAGIFARAFNDFYAEVFRRLEAAFGDVGYRGPAGIDAFLYRAADGRLRLKPIVEINPRYTMGRLTLELMQRVCPGSHGSLRLINLSQLRSAGCADFASYARRLGEEFPVRIEGEPVGRLREGVVCLNDPAVAAGCLAIFQVARDGDRRKVEKVDCGLDPRGRGPSIARNLLD